MNTPYSFYVTLILSIIVQFITGVIELATLFIKVDPKNMILRELLILEVVVQLVEAAFYFWLVYNFKKVTNVTPKRYIDWAITTPTMLITLVLYLIYLKYEESEMDTTKLSLFNLIQENSSNLSYILSLNWLMLIFGYLGEAKIINTIT